MIRVTQVCGVSHFPSLLWLMFDFIFKTFLSHLMHFLPLTWPLKEKTNNLQNLLNRILIMWKQPETGVTIKTEFNSWVGEIGSFIPHWLNILIQYCYLLSEGDFSIAQNRKKTPKTICLSVFLFWFCYLWHPGWKTELQRRLSLFKNKLCGKYKLLILAREHRVYEFLKR